MAYWRPRMAGRLLVPIMGSRAERIGQAQSTTLQVLPVRPMWAHITRNDHNHADELEIACNWREAGVDPRLLDNAVVELYMANADDRGNWSPSRENCRFVGLTQRINSRRSGESPAQVVVPVVDYTSLFLEARPFGSVGVPEYGDTLTDAWRRVVSQTPGAGALADRIVLQGIDGNPRLGDAVAQRFRNLGRVPVRPNTDAWTVWQQCVGMLGLISYIELDQVIVTTATNYYSEQDPPVLTWGRNLTYWEESRESAQSGKGVGVTSFDCVTQRTLEAVYPPPDDPRVKKKTVQATPVAGNIPARHREERDWYVFDGIGEQEVLNSIVQRIYEETSRQELEGKCGTEAMATQTISGAEFDLLALKAGDSVQVAIDDRERQLLANIETPDAQRRYLVDRGMTEEVAALIVANLANLRSLSFVYLTSDVNIELEATSETARFAIDVGYINRIVINEELTA